MKSTRASKLSPAANSQRQRRGMLKALLEPRTLDVEVFKVEEDVSLTPQLEQIRPSSGTYGPVARGVGSREGVASPGDEGVTRKISVLGPSCERWSQQML